MEALDRDVRKPGENPSVGLILCKDKDDAVVKYALSRTLSPAMVAEYQLHLPDRRVLQAKLRELTDGAVLEAEQEEADNGDWSLPRRASVQGSLRSPWTWRPHGGFLAGARPDRERWTGPHRAGQRR